MLCRFNYPHFPIKETTFIPGLSKDLSEEDIVYIKSDYKKIRKFLIRQTGYNQGKRDDNESWKKFRSWSFSKFLVELGMFDKYANTNDSIEVEKAYQRYKTALSASIKHHGLQ